MKIRNGFVSNSSSSSFVVVGIEFEVPKIIQEKLYEDNSEFVLLNNYIESKDGVCVKIISWDDNEWPSDSILDINQINNIEKQIQKEFNTTNKAKVYAGKRYC